ncbi:MULTISPECIES: hypothetical protein [Chryseobacterium]|uniref:hypothetical protein n=1 Tax=Chryseobacterium TaxID=59732 RepID=UPI00195CF969|nr:MULTISPECIES: hypothetical protein [Chryseobacterium]MBM7419016.1 hypothetical protein [Chryseobacterium sp. JUb44]MDH6208935.1 hypothetical protein [Chryseobacterium sp. BIGb0186]WSO11795.1 hypothetical protein VUJ64_07770 [Chryseobacterium scophthalmum]
MQENSKDEFLKIAEEYILNNAGDHVEVSYIEDYDELFVFGYQAKDKKVRLVGQGPIVLVKKDGRIFEYGSSTGDEEALVEVTNKLNKERLIRLFYKNYNIKNNNYDLIITDIYELDEGEHLNELITVLLRNRIQYFTHDENNGEQRHYYTKERLEETLEQTPANLGRYFCYNHLSDALVDLIKTNPYFKWTLSEVK